MIVVAKNRNVTVTPRKLQLLAESVKHLKPGEAVTQLNYLNYSGGTPLLKTIKQAIANATNNFKLSENDLKFHTIFIGKALSYRRGRPGPKGRFKPYEKTRSHITVELITKEAKETKSLTPKRIEAIDKTTSKAALKIKKAVKSTIKTTVK